MEERREGEGGGGERWGCGRASASVAEEKVGGKGPREAREKGEFFLCILVYSGDMVRIGSGVRGATKVTCVSLLLLR